MAADELIKKYYPDDRCEGTVAFYGWLAQDLSPEAVVLNVGAGPPTRQALRNLRGRAKRVVGVDVDPVVLANDELDEAHVIEGDRLPVPDAAFDVAVADFVLEHVEKPEILFAEIARALKAGGAFYFRTPNKHGYVALIARMTPHWFHVLVANRARGLPQDAHEPWRTYYRANSASTLEGLARRAGFASAEIRHFEPEPNYLVFNGLLFRAGVLYERIVNRFDALRGMRTSLMGRLVR